VTDNVPGILNKMLEADGIILASPNYINQVTASMKALFDRASHFIHCKRLLGKYIVAAVSSGSGQDGDVLDYIKYYGHTCGAQYSGGVSSGVPVSKEKMEEAYRLGVKFVSDIKEKKAYPEQIALIEEGKRHFREIIKRRKDEWIEEYLYWQNRGWL
jgi:multimeric flavodoxin WrbA